MSSPIRILHRLNGKYAVEVPQENGSWVLASSDSGQHDTHGSAQDEVDNWVCYLGFSQLPDHNEHLHASSAVNQPR